MLLEFRIFRGQIHKVWRFILITVSRMHRFIQGHFFCGTAKTDGVSTQTAITKSHWSWQSHNSNRDSIHFHCMEKKMLCKSMVADITSFLLNRRKKFISYTFFKITWGWVNDSFIFGWTVALNLVFHVHDLKCDTYALLLQTVYF